eukprot:103074-Chlamydomonas_euryale.AAC.1
MGLASGGQGPPRCRRRPDERRGSGDGLGVSIPCLSWSWAGLGVSWCPGAGLACPGAKLRHRTFNA